MNIRYNSIQVSTVIDQALIYQCACPAQVCRSILELRELYDYQMECAGDTTNDRLVHEAIAAASAQAHHIMEDCLTKVLEIEGWDPVSFVMPSTLRKKPVKLL